jgi:hypothetical protein
MKRWIALGAGVLVTVPTVVMLALGYRFRPKAEREDPVAVSREIATLTVTRDSLRELVYASAATSDLLDRRPAGDIVIGLPTPFVDAVVRSVVTGWFHDVDLRLPRMRVRKDGEITAKLGILGRRTVGSYDLDVVLDNVHGRLQPDVPVLTFGGDTIHVTVPVRVAGGTGVARVSAEWHSKGIAGPVCGDLSATRDVTGRVRARDYVARGRLVLGASDGAVFADPAFPGLAIRLFIDPARESVAALDSLLATKGGLCGFAVGKSHASERIQELVGRGFKVRIPQRFFRPIQLPVAVETQVPVANREVALKVVPSALSVTSSTVWIAAAVTPTKQVRSESKPAVAPR